MQHALAGRFQRAALRLQVHGHGSCRAAVLPPAGPAAGVQPLCGLTLVKLPLPSASIKILSPAPTLFPQASMTKASFTLRQAIVSTPLPCGGRGGVRGAGEAVIPPGVPRQAAAPGWGTAATGVDRCQGRQAGAHPACLPARAVHTLMSSAFSTKPGRCFMLHVGVKAPASRTGRGRHVLTPQLAGCTPRWVAVQGQGSNHGHWPRLPSALLVPAAGKPAAGSPGTANSTTFLPLHSCSVDSSFMLPSASKYLPRQKDAAWAATCGHCSASHWIGMRGVHTGWAACVHTVRPLPRLRPPELALWHLVANRQGLRMHLPAAHRQPSWAGTLVQPAARARGVHGRVSTSWPHPQRAGLLGVRAAAAPAGCALARSASLRSAAAAAAGGAGCWPMQTPPRGRWRQLSPRLAVQADWCMWLADWLWEVRPGRRARSSRPVTSVCGVAGAWCAHTHLRCSPAGPLASCIAGCGGCKAIWLEPDAQICSCVICVCGAANLAARSTRRQDLREAGGAHPLPGPGQCRSPRGKVWHPALIT
jgi:hypothetical protein